MHEFIAGRIHTGEHADPPDLISPGPAAVSGPRGTVLRGHR
jgi:hypothetical protein